MKPEIENCVILVHVFVETFKCDSFSHVHVIC